MRQLAFLLLLIVAGPARASEWVQLPGVSAYVDMASVRRDNYPKYAKGYEYIVAWIRGADTGGQSYKLEVAFDCKGRYGIVQQIAENETKDSRLHSYNYTRIIESGYPPISTIPPDSIYDVTASMVCKGKSPSP